MPERFKIIPSVYLILEQDGKVLLARRLNTGFEDGNYGLVSGHAEEKETLRQALAREIREEIGIELSQESIKHALTMHRNCGDHERIDFFFTASKWQGDITNMEPEKCDDLSWFSLDTLPENTIPYIRHALDCYQKGITYSEFAW